jgi:imidazolonepropionase-like amidohydrolase
VVSAHDCSREKMSLRHFAAVFAVLGSAIAASAHGDDLALIHARIYASPDATPILDGVVLIHDGRISAVGDFKPKKIPPGSKIVDLKGSVVTAGFWNSHVHLMNQALLNADQRSSAELANELRQMLTRWGFTTVFDTASLLKNTNVIRRRIASKEIAGPMILTLGDPFYPKGGTPIYVKQFMKDNGFPDEEIASLSDALARARRQIQQEGADGIKLFAGAIVGGEVGVLAMPLDQARALAAAAHALGKPVFAHPSDLDGLNVSIDSGVDVLAHTTPMSGPWSPELAARIVARHIALIPTLTLFEVEAKKFEESEEDSKNDMDAAVQQVEVFTKAGGPILFGTDVGYTDAFDTTEEYRQLARALSWRQILASLTVSPAEKFGFAAHKGKLSPGQDADLVVLDADPAKDVTAFAKVQLTIRGGRIIFDANDKAVAPTPYQGLSKKGQIHRPMW